MLLGNYTPLSANPGRCITHAIPNPYKWRSTGNVYGFYTGDAVVSGETEKSSFPNGYVPPYTWVLSPVAGGLSSCNEVLGNSDLSITSLSLGKALDSSIAGVGAVLSPSLSLITSLIAALAGTGELTASMVGSVSLAASLAGSGSLTASIGLLANLIATLTSTGSLDATLRGTATLGADIYVNESQASTSQLVYAIWNALAASYNETGTMGEKMNSAGTAGDPWTADLTNYNTTGTAGKKLKDLKNPSVLIDGEIIV